MPNGQFLDVIAATEANPVNAAILLNALDADQSDFVLPVQLWNGQLSEDGRSLAYTGSLLDPNSTLDVVDLSLPVVPEEVGKWCFHSLAYAFWLRALHPGGHVWVVLVLHYT